MPSVPSSVSITWVNHASYVLEVDGCAVLADPWLGGTAFNDGWSHYSPTSFDVRLKDRITHIWVSHEHPDHFAPSSLRSFDEKLRQGITVLYQASRDGKVVDFCRRLGFGSVIEMRPNQWVPLSDALSVMCNPWRLGDSYLAAETPAGMVLNLNDCVIRTQREAAAILADVGGRSPKVVLTQFSYANRVGNPEDTELRRSVASDELDSVVTQLSVLQPEFVVPYASFVWFSHEENAYMNDGLSSVGDAVDVIRTRTAVEPVVLYPGDAWSLDEDPPDLDQRVSLYAADLSDKLNGPPLGTSGPPLPFDALVDQGQRFAEDLRSVNGRLRLALLHRVGLLPSAAIWIDDLARAATLSHVGLKEAEMGRDSCDISLTSHALSFMLTNRFGGTTLFINGRFTTPPGGDVHRVTPLVNLRESNNRGRASGRWVFDRAHHRIERALPAGSRPARWLRSHR